VLGAMSTKEAYTAERRVYLKAFAANVRRLREEHDPPLSQTELYDSAKLHRTEIGRIETGRVEPRLMVLHILADSLDVTIDELIAELPVPVERKPAPKRKAGRKAKGSRTR
jgi:DNA-binding XRE family transcriptional regulator